MRIASAVSLLTVLFWLVACGSSSQTLDSDRDGIADAVDRCPTEPEDSDGFFDSDGCADPDNDEDGIEDQVDECPFDAEDFDGVRDTDGCPDADEDSDGDGVSDRDDACPNDPGPATSAGGRGCPSAGAPVRRQASTADSFESVARSFVTLLRNPTEVQLAALLPTVNDLVWALENHVPSRYRSSYPTFYRDAPTARQNLVAERLDFGELRYAVSVWSTTFPVLPMDRVVYVTHEARRVSTDASRADAVTHIVDVTIAFPFEGFGKLEYIVSILVLNTPDRVALMGYMLVDYDEDAGARAWELKGTASDAFVQGFVNGLKKGDRIAFADRFSPSRADALWTVRNRMMPDDQKFVKDVYDLESSEVDPSWNEQWEYLIGLMFDEVESAVPDPDMARLLGYHLFIPEGTLGEFVTHAFAIEIETASGGYAMFPVFASQGPARLYLAPVAIEVLTDRAGHQMELSALPTRLYVEPSTSIAESR